MSFDALIISGIFSPNTKSKTRNHSLDTATEKLRHPEGIMTPFNVSTFSPIKWSHEKMHSVHYVNLLNKNRHGK